MTRVTLADGDTVLVDHQRDEARQGRIFAVRRQSDLLVKRIQKEPHGGWMLTSDNEDYEPVDTGADFSVIGEIVWRGAWIGEKMASRKQIADIDRLFEMLAQQGRVDSGAAASIEEAIAAIEAEAWSPRVFLMMTDRNYNPTWEDLARPEEEKI